MNTTSIRQNDTAPAPQAEAAPDGFLDRHVEALQAMRSMFSEDRIPSPCHEREALDAAITALATPQASQPATGRMADMIEHGMSGIDWTPERPQASQPAAGDVALEMRVALSSGEYPTKPISNVTLCDWIKRLEAIPPKPAGAVRVDDAWRMAIELLIAAGYVTRGRANEALHLAALAQPAAPSDQEAGNG